MQELTAATKKSGSFILNFEENFQNRMAMGEGKDKTKHKIYITITRIQSWLYNACLAKNKRKKKNIFLLRIFENSVTIVFSC